MRNSQVEVNGMVMPDDIRAMTNLKAVRAAMELTIKSMEQPLLRYAWLMRRYEQLGGNLADIELSLAPYLRGVPDGTIAIEAVNRFGGGRLMPYVANLQIEEQRRLAGGAKIVVVSQCARDKTKTKDIETDPRSLRNDQITQVFREDGGIRTPKEQREYLESRTERADRSSKQSESEDARPTVKSITRKAVAALKKLDKNRPGFDMEECHLSADEILLVALRESGFKEIADEYEKTRDRIGFCYT